MLPEGEEATWGAIEAVIPKHLAEAAARASVGASDIASEEDGEMSPTVDDTKEEKSGKKKKK